MKKFKITFKNDETEEKTEFEIRSEYKNLTSTFKQMLFRLKFNEELYHVDTMTHFKRIE